MVTDGPPATPPDASHTPNGKPSAAAAAGAPRAVAAQLSAATAEFAAAELETPKLDAEVLLAHVLGWSRTRLASEPDAQLDDARAATFAEAVRRRSILREPVAYITGIRHFRRLELAVDRSVLIPRPETELLVAVALDLPQGARVLDVGTGSGAVALALKDERPDLLVTASDISEDALAVARSNASRLGLDVSFVRANLLDGVPAVFDAVLSNPPYVAESERFMLAPEILEHEPPEALFAGDDGLAVIGALLDQLAPRTRTRVVVLEVGAGQAERVGALTRAAGFASVRTESDLAGIPRVVIGERRA